MKITFLGTGTSMGIPMIGCNCSVCTSEDPKDKRLRTSVWIEIDNKHIVIDAGIDFRQQALRKNISRIDAVLFTHHHVDHIFGLDDLRAITILQKRPVEIYANVETLENLKRVYPYVLNNNYCPSSVPTINHTIIDENPFMVKGVQVLPIPLFHGDLPIFGFRLGNFAYCTDVSEVPMESYRLLKNLNILVLGALRHRPHPTHFTLSEAVTIAKKIGAVKTYLVHMSHELSHSSMVSHLSTDIQPAYDGLEIELI